MILNKSLFTVTVKIFLMILLAVFVFQTDVQAQTAQELARNWKYKRLVRGESSVPAANCPIKLTLTATNFDYSKAQNDGDDIRFADEDGNILVHQYEGGYQFNGNTFVSVQAPVGADRIYMYYGNPNATSGTGTWAPVACVEVTPDPKTGGDAFFGCTGDGANGDEITSVTIDKIDVDTLQISIGWSADPNQGSFTASSGVNIQAHHYDGVIWRTKIYNIHLPNPQGTAGGFPTPTVATGTQVFNYDVPYGSAFGTNYIRASIIDKENENAELNTECASAAGVGRHFDNKEVTFNIEVNGLHQAQQYINNPTHFGVPF